MMNIRYRVIGLWIWFSILLISTGKAQTSTYAFSQSVVAYSSSSSGNVLGNASNSGHLAFLDSNAPQGSSVAMFGPGIPIGFDFIYNGIIYDRFGVLNNGWICLGRSQYGMHAVDIGQFQFQPLESIGPLNDTLRARIVGFDANLAGNGATSKLTYEVIGDSTDLTLIVKWKKYKVFQSSGSNNTNINFEIRLNALSQSIDIRYGDMVALNYSANTNSNVGLGGFARSDFNNRRTLASKNWNLTTAGINFSDDCVFQSASNMPEIGLNFNWSPSLCPPIKSVQKDYITNNLAQLSWALPAGVSNPQFEYVLNTVPSAPVSGAITNLTSINFTGLSPATLYYFHIRLRCSSSLQSSWVNVPVKTRCNALLPPYLEDFESVSTPALPGCLDVLNNDVESQTWVTGEKIGLNSAYATTIPYEAILTNDDWLFLPAITLEEDTNYIFSADYASFNYDTMTIYAGRYPSPDSMSAIGWFTIDNESYYKQNFLLYTPETDGNYYIGLRVEGADVRVDNLSLKKYNCFIPQNIAVRSNALNRTVLDWDAVSTGTTYEYAISTQDYYPPQGVQTTTADSIVVTGLTPRTTYHIFLRSNCGAGVQSPWTHFIFDSKSDIDECASALLISSFPTTDCEGNVYSTKGASNSGIPATTCTGYADDDVWFKFVATQRSHSIRLMSQCYGGGGGGGTQANRSVEELLCGPLIMELRKIGCGDSLVMCVEIAPGYTGFLDPTNLVIGNTYYIRVFGKDTLVIGQNFSLCVGAYPIETNNTCSSALMIPVSTTTCPSGTERNIAGANSSNTPVSNCDTGPYYDLWYKFVTTSTKHIIDVTFSTGDGILDVFDGNCNGFVALACANNTTSGPEQLTLSGLTIGDTLWIRVYDAGNTGAQMKVSVCVRSPAINDECANAILIATVSGITQANPVNANSFSASGNESCNGYFADDDLWFRFTAINATHIIVAIPITPGAMSTPVIEVFGGDCNSSSIGCSNTGEKLLTGLIPGNEYYFRVYSANNLDGKGNFRVGITIPPPNIYCNTAIPLPINTTTVCNLNTLATEVGAGVKNEIWFSFVPDQSTMSIVVGETIGAELALYDACNGNFLMGDQNFGLLYFNNYIPGHTYYLKIYTGLFLLNNYQFFQEPISICIIGGPVNDECSGATLIYPQANCINATLGNTAGSTPSPGNNPCAPLVNDVWYRFVATATSHEIIIDPDPGTFYISGQVYLNGCTGTPLTCFTIGSNLATTVVDGLEKDSMYFIRVTAYSPTSSTGSFSLCVSASLTNDHCSYATVIVPGTTSVCRNSYPGSTINATSSLGRQNVWYKFTAVSKEATIVVTTLTPRFDAGIKIWNPTTGITLDNCVFTLINTIDEAHIAGQPEILSVTNLIAGQDYYVEVYTNIDSLIPGDFEICMFSPEDNMTVYGVTSETYPFDTTVSAGSWNQPVTKVVLQMTGRAFNNVIHSISFDATGTTDMQDVLSAKVFVDTKVWGFHNSTILPFSPFGKVGQGLAEYPPPYLFGDPILHPGQVMNFEGEYVIEGERYSSGSNNYPRFIYLVLELACDADPGHVIKAICTSVVVDRDSLTPVLGNTDPLLMVPLDSYDTRQDGPWENGTTWVCGSPPPNDPDLPPVNIYHRVALTDSVNVGSVNIYYERSLAVTDDAVLTLGATSMGDANGLSDKFLSCNEGSLLLDHATLNINGGFSFGSAGGERYGNGLCCQNGTGSYALSVGTTVIARDSTFVSVDYVPFCVEGGEVVNADSPNTFVNRMATDTTTEQKSFSLFTLDQGRRSLDLPEAIESYTMLALDPQVLHSILEGDYKQLSLTLPQENRDALELILETSDQFQAQSVVRAAPANEVIELPTGKHFNGHIKNRPNSIVAISIFENEVIGLISEPGKGNLLLGKHDDHGSYMMYADHQIKQYQKFGCETPDDGLPYADEQIHFKSDGRAAGDCIRIYLEVDNDIVADKGGLTPAYNYVSAVFNQIAILYANENINISLSDMILWTNASPYTQPTLLQTLGKFQETRPVFNGDFGLLLSYRFNAGYANLAGLCKAEQKYSTGYCGIEPSFANVPTYSWTVEVIAHELGHLFGSRHTHACVWNGDQTAIDGCFIPEGNCNTIPDYPSAGGTIMSYCHQTEVGINLSLGFGVQPGNVMRYSVANALCTSSCANVACSMNDVSMVVKTDSNPNETTWEIQNELNITVAKGGPYITSNFIHTRHACLPDGCYRLIVMDGTNSAPGGTFIAKDSKIIVDGNDGVNANPNNLFRILNSNMFNEHLNVTMLDPSSFLYNTDHSETQTLNGTLTLGGGDDTGTTDGFSLLLGPGNSTGFLLLDSLIVQGGYASVHRHAKSSNNFIACTNLWIKAGSEFEGGLAIKKEFRNDGLYTGKLNRNLSFCGNLNIGQHYPNSTNTHRMYGTGLVRPFISSPIPSSRADNQINMLRLDNTHSGLILEMPLGVLNTLRLLHGRIDNSIDAVVTLGDSITNGKLSTDPTNTQWFAEDAFTGNLNTWDGGVIMGPFRRWFEGNTVNEKSVMPLGSGNVKRTVGINFQNSPGGYLTGQFIGQQPGILGLPLANEQNTTIGFVSPTGYWHFTTDDVLGNYDVSVRASGFTQDGVKLIADLPGVRMIKRPTNGAWALSGSTTVTGPASLAEVKSSGLNGFSDFGIGTGCGNMVTAASDNTVGSLRYVLANCIASGDTVKFDSSLSLLIITTDTILLNKNVTIYATAQDNIVIQGSGVHTVIKNKANITAKLQNIELITGSGVNGRAILNLGNLSLHNITIHDQGTGGSAILNKGTLMVIGNTEVIQD